MGQTEDRHPPAKRIIDNSERVPNATLLRLAPVRLGRRDFVLICNIITKSNELNENHLKRVTNEELIELLKGEHERDHRHAETCYSSLREKYYPVVRETIIALYKQFIKCQACEKQAPLPKTSLVRKTILATYPLSRWQMDLKNCPAVVVTNMFAT